MADKKELDEKAIVEENTKKAARDMFLEYGPFIILIVFILIIRIFIASPFKVDGTSMSPTLEDRDYMLLYKLKKHVKGIHREDVVVIDSSQGLIIKRVIGLPNESLKYEVKEVDGVVKGILYIDNKIYEENFITDDVKTKTCTNNPKLCNEGIELGEDEYFVMGDNRAVSLDSRMLGTFHSKDIKGMAELRLFPFSKFGNIKK